MVDVGLAGLLSEAAPEGATALSWMADWKVMLWVEVGAEVVELLAVTVRLSEALLVGLAPSEVVLVSTAREIGVSDARLLELGLDGTAE